MKTVAVIGGGSWGTALANLLAARLERVSLWIHDPQLAQQVSFERENRIYLPGFPLPHNIFVTHSMAECLQNTELALLVVPSHVMRSVALQLALWLPTGVPLVSASKGLEQGTHFRLSQILEETLPAHPVAVLSGPSFASEVAGGKPTALVAASANIDLARLVQSVFSGKTFRVYTSRDVIGVELGGAIKNVVAIGAGVCDGLQLGANALAALVTRGLAEITRLAVALGAQPQTLAGLAGLGDLVLTCTGDLSRNRRVGIQLARGQQLCDIISETRMVAEGVGNARTVVELGHLHDVELPIASEMDRMLHLNQSPRRAIQSLMERSLRDE